MLMRIFSVISPAFFLLLPGCVSAIRNIPYTSDLYGWVDITQVKVECSIPFNHPTNGAKKLPVEKLRTTNEVQVSITDEASLRELKKIIEGPEDSWRTFGASTLPTANRFFTITRSDGTIKRFRSDSDLITIDDLDGWRRISELERIGLRKYIGKCAS